ncbi:MAG: cupin domain-containing protein [Solirubrobacteraceae bacterium]
MPLNEWAVGRRHRWVVALFVAGAVAAVAGGVVQMGGAASASSVPQPRRIDLAAGYPSFARGYRLSLTEAVLPPGAGFPAHRHPGMQVAYVQSGTLQYTVFRGRLKIFRGHPGSSQKLVGVLRAGQTGSIRAGEWIVETPSLHHRGANTGHKRVVILLATLLRSDEPPAIPVAP